MLNIAPPSGLQRSTPSSFRIYQTLLLFFILLPISPPSAVARYGGRVGRKDSRDQEFVEHFFQSFESFLNF